MNQMERAVDEDKASEKVIRAVAYAEHYKRMKLVLSSTKFVGRFPLRVDLTIQKNPCGEVALAASDVCKLPFPECRKGHEDDHLFDSTGQCRHCGAHRRPV